ncbi:MAG: DUF190 domain-containing protein, partial [Streptosporangiaceae bacterium]
PSPRQPDDLLAVAETVAIGSRPQIEAALDRAFGPDDSGLLTLKQARLLSEEIDPVGLWDNVDEATKLTIYFSRHDLVYQVPAYEVICELLSRRGIAGATALAGIGGILRGDNQAGQFASRNGVAPMIVIAIGSGAQLGLVLPELGGLHRHPLITLEQVRVCKRDGQVISLPQTGPGTDADGRPVWQKLAVYACDSVRHDGHSIHRAIVHRLHAAGISGATLRGLWGFHGEHPPHGGRHVPGVTIVVDIPERIPAAFAVIDELTAARGLVTSESVTAIRGGSQDL